MFLKYQEATCYFYIKLKTVDWLFDMFYFPWLKITNGKNKDKGPGQRTTDAKDRVTSHSFLAIPLQCLNH